MTEENWIEVTANIASLPGPKAYFVSGYGPKQVTVLRTFLDEQGYPDIPLTTCTATHMDAPLEKALSEKSDSSPLEEGKLPYALVLSGVTFNDVQIIMQNFLKTGLPRPIFATTTENNLRLTVKALLKHLLEEQKAAIETARQRNR